MVETKDPQTGKKDRLITILGPTASGKTNRAVSLCKAFGGEIISADSRQIYRGMDLGSGKDLEEYQGITYHLIDICDAGEKYNLHRYISDFYAALSKIKESGNIPVVCGGSGMYLENALSGIRLPEVPCNIELRESLQDKNLAELTEILKKYKTLHNTTDIDTAKRAVRAIEIEEYYRNHPEFAKAADRRSVNKIDSLIIGIDIPREVRRKKISMRLQDRLDRGMVEEVRGLIKKGINPEDLIYYGLEYKYLTLYIMGNLKYEDMVNQLEIAIHQFAKRQMTWFRGMEKRGFKIHWLPYDIPGNEFVEIVKDLYYKD